MPLLLKKISHYSILLIMISSLSGCMTYKEVEMVKVTDVSVKNFSTKGVQIEVSMQIKNPNNYKISIVDSDLDLFVTGKKMGSATIENKITLPKRSNEVHRFLIQTKLENMASGALPIMMAVMGGKAIEIGVQGDIKARAKGLSKKFPVDFTEKVKL